VTATWGVQTHPIHATEAHLPLSTPALSFACRSKSTNFCARIIGLWRSTKRNIYIQNWKILEGKGEWRTAAEEEDIRFKKWRIIRTVLYLFEVTRSRSVV
jgi:hypothetical protein